MGHELLMRTAFFNYGDGAMETYPLSELCMVEFGRGEHLFSPKTMKRMELRGDGLYVVCTFEDESVKVCEVSEEMSLTFLPV